MSDFVRRSGRLREKVAVETKFSASMPASSFSTNQSERLRKRKAKDSPEFMDIMDEFKNYFQIDEKPKDDNGFIDVTAEVFCQLNSSAPSTSSSIPIKPPATRSSTRLKRLPFYHPAMFEQTYNSSSLGNSPASTSVPPITIPSKLEESLPPVLPMPLNDPALDISEIVNQQMLRAPRTYKKVDAKEKQSFKYIKIRAKNNEAVRRTRENNKIKKIMDEAKYEQLRIRYNSLIDALKTCTCGCATKFVMENSNDGI